MSTPATSGNGSSNAAGSANATDSANVASSEVTAASRMGGHAGSAATTAGARAAVVSAGSALVSASSRVDDGAAASPARETATLTSKNGLNFATVRQDRVAASDCLFGEERPELSRGQLVRISTGMLGVMFGWAMKTVLTTPLFRDVYGVDTADLGFVWLAGPLSGLLVQPVIGVISDHREGPGQRSIFFAGGSIVMALSLAVLPTAGAITRALFGDSDHADGGGDDTRMTAGTGLAVSAFWSLDLAMNASLVSIRSLIADFPPPRQQPKVNTVILISYGAGTLLGYAFSAVNVAPWLGLPPSPFWKACVNFWAAALFLVAAAGVATAEALRLERRQSPPPRALFSSLVTHDDDDGGDVNSNNVVALSGGRGGDLGNGEMPRTTTCHDGSDSNGIDFSSLGPDLERICSSVDDVCRSPGGQWMLRRRGESNKGDAQGNIEGSGTEELQGAASRARLLEMVLFYDLPGWLRSVCLLLFFSWVGWFAIIIFGSDWVGVNVFGGNPSAASSADNEHEGGIKVITVLLFVLRWVMAVYLHRAYEDGVAWASLGLALQAVVVTGMGCGPVTWLVETFGLKGGFLTAVVSQAALLFIAAFVQPGPLGKGLALAILGALGIPLSLIESLPYMMVGMFSPRHTHGQLLGKLNVWIVLAQLALTLCVHPIVTHTKDGDSSVLVAGAVAAAIGIMFVPGIGRAGKSMTHVAPSTSSLLAVPSSRLSDVVDGLGEGVTDGPNEEDGVGVDGCAPPCSPHKALLERSGSQERRS